MITDLKCPELSGLNILIITIITGILLGNSLFFEPVIKKAEAGLIEAKNEVKIEDLEGKLALVQENSLLPIPLPGSEISVVKEMEIIVTAYSSSPCQTDDTPFITAAGTRVREGIVAANFLPFGTKIRLPEIYGDRIFVVEDRMSPKKGYQIDIWFPEYQQALNFGVKRTQVVILDS